jgi:hypothetical protein
VLRRDIASPSCVATTYWPVHHEEVEKDDKCEGVRIYVRIHGGEEEERDKEGCI